MGAAPPLSRRAGAIRLLALDADGVLTDGRIWIADASGREWATGFSVRDGYGVRAAMRAGIEIAVISGRDSYGLRLRLSELGIRLTSLRCRDKQAALTDLLDELALTPDQAAFVGDDVVDLPAMRLAGFAVAVADAHSDVLKEADWITSLPGGHGAVREVCDFLLAARS